MGLIDLLQVGKGMCGLEALPSSLAAAVLEAIIAAIYKDSGRFETVRDFILQQFGPHVERRGQRAPAQLQEPAPAARPAVHGRHPLLRSPR